MALTVPLTGLGTAAASSTDSTASAAGSPVSRPSPSVPGSLPEPFVPLGPGLPSGEPPPPRLRPPYPAPHGMGPRGLVALQVTKALPPSAVLPEASELVGASPG